MEPKHLSYMCNIDIVSCEGLFSFICILSLSQTFLPNVSK